MLSSTPNALLTHTLASFWRKQSCLVCCVCIWAKRFEVYAGREQLNLTQSPGRNCLRPKVALQLTISDSAEYSSTVHAHADLQNSSQLEGI